MAGEVSNSEVRKFRPHIRVVITANRAPGRLRQELATERCTIAVCFAQRNAVGRKLVGQTKAAPATCCARNSAMRPARFPAHQQQSHGSSQYASESQAA